MKQRPERGNRTGLWIGLGIFALTAVVIGYGVYATRLSFEAKNVHAGLQQLVENIRRWPAIPTGDNNLDITGQLRAAGLVPDRLQQAPWGEPLQVRLNRGGALPVIEVALSGLTAARCEHYIAYISHHTRRRDLYSVWLAGPGVMLTQFPVSPPIAGCQGNRITARLQYRLTPPPS